VAAWDGKLEIHPVSNVRPDRTRRGKVFVGGMARRRPTAPYVQLTDGSNIDLRQPSAAAVNAAAAWSTFSNTWKTV
jgi:hypothetical protein